MLILNEYHQLAKPRFVHIKCVTKVTNPEYYQVLSSGKSEPTQPPLLQWIRENVLPEN